jgi:hypothetical protein
MRTLRALVALGATAVGTAACAGGDGGPAAPGGGTGDGSLSARINGASWTAAPSTVVTVTSTPALPGSLAMQGSTLGAPARVLQLFLTRIPGVGTYPLGINTGTGTGGIANVIEGGQSWSTPLSGAAGTVTISSLTDTRVRGSFSFQATSIIGSGAAVTVTDGQFDVARSASYVTPTAAQLGSVVSASLGGANWNAATVAVAGASGTYVIVGSNTTHQISMTVGPITAPGSGPLSATMPVRRITVQRLADGVSWGGTAGDQGTIAISVISADRIVGTFTATLAPAGTNASQPALAIAGGTFDVRLGP